MDQKADAIAVSGDLSYVLSVLTVPTLLAQIAQTVGWLGEAYFVSRLGDAATAAIGAVGQVGWLLMTLMMTVSVGTTTLIAQRWGAGDREGARSLIGIALQQAVAFGLLVMSLWFFQDDLWRWLGVKREVVEMARVYLAGTLFSAVPLSIAMTLMAVYRGIGDMMTPFWATVVIIAVQLLLDATLIPLWGMNGAAVAIFVSRGVGFAYLLWRFLGSDFGVSFSQLFRWSSGMHRQLLALGLPAGVQGLQRSFASVVYFSILARTRNATAALAALTAGLRLESLAFMPGVAFGIAAQTLVGQNIGARHWERAYQGGWQAGLRCAGIMGVVGAFFLVAADWLATRFTHDPVTHHYIATYLRINAISEPFLGLGLTLGGALRGTGDTLSPALISVVAQWLLRLPATYILCLYAGYDAIAAWWTMSLSTIFSGILVTWVFARSKGRVPLPR